jgi:hypothetical protein
MVNGYGCDASKVIVNMPGRPTGDSRALGTKVGAHAAPDLENKVRNYVGSRSWNSNRHVAPKNKLTVQWNFKLQLPLSISWLTALGIERPSARD